MWCVSVCYGRGREVLLVRRVMRRCCGDGVRCRMVCWGIEELCKGFGALVDRGVGGKGSEKDDTDKLSWS